MGCSQSAVVSIYRKWSKEGIVVNRQLMPDMGSKGRTMRYNPTDELLMLKLLKKLMLVLTERCQNTMCIAVCCVLGRSGQSGCPCWCPATTDRANNRQVSIRTGPHSSGRRWPGLMNHVFFYITRMAGCMCIAYLGNTWHQDALWEEGKPAEMVWCFGQCSARKHWMLPSMWMLLWHVPPT